ncbi:Uncharacterised protein [Mycobacteroides abscessus subsp. abscessus]|nr:Uncharacterised protein [Mycobacteroides abscessus subsp. abscessus]
MAQSAPPDSFCSDCPTADQLVTSFNEWELRAKRKRLKDFSYFNLRKLHINILGYPDFQHAVFEARRRAFPFYNGRKGNRMLIFKLRNMLQDDLV